MNKLIYFYSQTCSPCHQMGPIINQISNTGIEVIKIDTGTDNPQTKKFNVRSVPTLIKTNAHNDDLGRLVGFNTFGKVYEFFKQG